MVYTGRKGELTAFSKSLREFLIIKDTVNVMRTNFDSDLTLYILPECCSKNVISWTGHDRIDIWNILRVENEREKMSVSFKWVVKRQKVYRKANRRGWVIKQSLTPLCSTEPHTSSFKADSDVAREFGLSQIFGLGYILQANQHWAQLLIFLRVDYNRISTWCLM